MINSKDISVVLHGPLREETIEASNSIRRFLPESEIILSTWCGSDTSCIDYDTLIASDMPPAYVQHERLGVVNNLNRMLRSIKAGIKVANRQYILRMRSDMILDSAAFLDTFEKYPARSDRSVLRHKILIPTLFSRTAYRKQATPFHLSDWVAFGLSEDIRSVFLPTLEVKEPEFTQWFRRQNDSPFGTTTFRMAPEQYIFLSFYRRHFNDIEMNDCRDNGDDVLRASNIFTVSNFIVAEYRYTGFRLPKYPASINESEIGREFLETWNQFTYETAYKKFCDSSFVVNVPEEKQMYQARPLTEIRLRLKKHVNSLKNCNRPNKYIEEVFAILFICICFLFLKLTNKFENYD